MGLAPEEVCFEDEGGENGIAVEVEVLLAPIVIAIVKCSVHGVGQGSRGESVIGIVSAVGMRVTGSTALIGSFLTEALDAVLIGPRISILHGESARKVEVMVIPPQCPLLHPLHHERVH
jgi:hypothetical protein